MIFNKFSPVFPSSRLKNLILQLIVLSIFSCNKTANINANKAFVSFTNMAYGSNPLTLQVDSPIFTAIPFDSATGYPYSVVISKISNMTIFDGVDTFLTGFSSFRQGAYYSIYVYDTLDPRSKSLIILQDNPPLNSDTTVSVRYMNFTPSSLIGLLLVNTRDSVPLARDTVVISPEYFVGANINPAYYTFQPILAGNYNITAFTDSARPNPDSSNFRYLGYYPISISANYNFNLAGFGTLDSGQYKFQLKTIPLN